MASDPPHNMYDKRFILPQTLSNFIRQTETLVFRH